MPVIVNAPLPTGTSSLGVGAIRDAAAESLIQNFGPSPVLSQLLDQHQGYGREVAATTLAEAVKIHGGFSSTQTVQLREVIRLQSGWHSVFAPLQRTDKHQLTITTIIPNKFALDRNPESVAPRFVTERSETRSFTLAHFHLGARFFHEFYKTDEGIAQAKSRQITILQAAVISCKLTVAMAAVANGFYHRKARARSGMKYKNVFDALSKEVQLFGVFMKDKFAIYKIAQDIDAITQQTAGGGEYTPLNNFVVGTDLLNQITVSNKAETNPTSREASVASQMLSLGARALPNVLPNRTIYEDVAWSLENVPVDEMHVFRRVATVGQYYMIDGSRAGASGPISIKDELSIKIPDFDRDDYTRYGIEEALRHDMRYTANGDVTPKLEEFISNLPEVMERTGLRPSDARAIDPFVWRATNPLAPTVSSSTVSARDYRSVAFFGDMDYLYWSKDQMMQHARAAAAAARTAAQVNSEFANGLREYHSLVDELYTLPASTTTGEQNALYLYIYALYKSNINNASNNKFDVTACGSLRLPKIFRFDAVQELYAFGYSDKNVDYILSLGDTAANHTITEHPTTTAGLIAVVADNIVHDISFRQNFARPWGFGSLNHFRALADLVGNKVYQFYNQTYFVRARDVVRTLDVYLDSLKRIYGSSEIWSAFYVPSYAASGNGDEHYDSFHSVATNIIDRVRHPLWIDASKINPAVVPVSTKASDAWTLIMQSVTSFGADQQTSTPATFSKTFMGQFVTLIWTIKDSWDSTTKKLKTSATHLAFLTNRIVERYANVGEFETAIGALPSKPATVEDFITIIGASASGKSMVDNLFNGFANITTEVAKNFGFHEQVNFVETESVQTLTQLIGHFNNHSVIGLSLNTSLNASYSHSFEYVLTGAILAYVNAKSTLGADAKKEEKQLAYTFAIFVNYLRMLHYRHNITTPLTDRVIVAAISNNQIAPSERINDKTSSGGAGDPALRKRARDDGVQAASSDMNNYINTRLLFNPAVYATLQNVTIGVGAGQQSVVGVVIFAEHPDIGNPLVGHTPTGGGTAQLPGPFFTSHSRSGGLNHTVFAHPSLLLTTTSGHASNKRSRIDYFGALPSSVRNDSDYAQNASIDSAFDTRDARYLTGAVRNNITGPLYSVDSMSAKATAADIRERHNLIARLDALTSEAQDEETRIAGMLCVFSRNHRSTLETWLGFNLPIPMSCYIVAHPFIRLETEAMLAFAAGAGILYYAHEDVSNQYENASKQWLLHFSGWFGCYIADEAKLMVLPDVRIIQCVGGLDLQVYDDLNEFDANSLDFKKSAFVFSCGGMFSRDIALKCANPLSLFGKYDVRQFPYSFENEQRIFTQSPQWPGALFYNYLWAFHSMNRIDEAGFENYRMMVNEPGVTGLMLMGTHYAWAHNQRDHTSEIRGTGHLGSLRAPFSKMFSSGITYDS